MRGCALIDRGSDKLIRCSAPLLQAGRDLVTVKPPPVHDFIYGGAERRHEGWAQRPCFPKKEPVKSGQLGTQACSHEFGLHRFRGIIARLGTPDFYRKNDLQNSR